MIARIARRSRWLAASLALALSACMQLVLVGPDTVTVGNALEVKTPVAWSSATVGPNDVWTVDGTPLEELRFAVAIENDSPIFSTSADKKMPVFRSDMTAVEVAEQVVASLATIGMAEPKTSNLRPVTFAGTPGFRFDLSMKTKEGLDWQGFAVGAVKDKKLYLMVYTGAKLYYFGKEKNDVEKIVDSARIL